MKPRYLIMTQVARYGGRDEYIGCDRYLKDTAFTHAWADRQAQVLARLLGCDDSRDPDYDVIVIDTRPGELDRTRPVFSLWDPEFAGSQFDPDYIPF